MQLILETENTCINISEKMTTLDQAPFEEALHEKPASNGKTKELNGEINENTENDINPKEIVNIENTNASNEDSGYKSSASEVISESHDEKHSNNEITDTKAETVSISDTCTEKLTSNEIQPEVSGNNSDKNTETKTTSNNDISDTSEVSKNNQDSLMDIDIEHDKDNLNSKEIIAEEASPIEEFEEPMEVDCNGSVGKVLEKELTQSISAMVNEIVEGLNNDDSAGELEFEKSKDEIVEDSVSPKDGIKDLEVENKLENKTEPAAESNHIASYIQQSEPLVDSVSSTETSSETDKKAQLSDKKLDDNNTTMNENVVVPLIGDTSKSKNELEEIAAIESIETADVKTNTEAPKEKTEIESIGTECVKTNIEVPEEKDRIACIETKAVKTNIEVPKDKPLSLHETDNAVPDDANVKKDRKAANESLVPCEDIIGESTDIPTVEEENVTTENHNKSEDIQNSKEQESHNLQENIDVEKFSDKSADVKDCVPSSEHVKGSETETKESVLIVEDLHNKQPEHPVSAPEAKKPNEEIAKNISVEKPIKPIISLSNTMEILSDDEDESNKPSPQSEPQSTLTSAEPVKDSKTINLDDDDDIMVIDEVGSKDDKSDKVLERIDKKEENATTESEVVKLDSSLDNETNETENRLSTKEEDAKTEDTVKKNDETKDETLIDTSTAAEEKPKPLVPDDFFKTYRKNLMDMTRDDLEEFCILKIVESIIDRSNLNDIRAKLKTMAQSVEEYKKKAMMLTKQNRDLQVVLKSVQEEQKKASNQQITPLKITRSVGMQVLMTDKSRRRPPGANINNPIQQTSNTSNIHSPMNNNTNNRQIRQIPNQNTRTTPQKANQQIPVPRLVPATQIANKNANQTANSSAAKNSNSQNGMKITPVQKAPEKRQYNKINSSSSVTVDLTDDEPPTKVTPKNTPQPPVRLVNTQNLMIQRAPFPQAGNSPRKVYIPINVNGQPTKSGTPGQTILVKTATSPGPRHRGPAPALVRAPQTQTIPVRRLQGARHPAPLPDAMKQYQPPNWKALPPAPDLKLSKVENGIVISWKIEGYQEDSYEEIASYQLYAYQETSAPPSTSLWKKIGDVKALPLPMACTLTQFMAGYKYYFAVRAVDIRSRLGPFSLPGSILLLNKM